MALDINSTKDDETDAIVHEIERRLVLVSLKTDFPRQTLSLDVVWDKAAASQGLTDVQRN